MPLEITHVKMKFENKEFLRPLGNIRLKIGLSTLPLSDHECDGAGVVVVDEHFILDDKSILRRRGHNDTASRQGLLEMGENRRPRHGLEAFQLATCGDEKTLQKRPSVKSRQEKSLRILQKRAWWAACLDEIIQNSQGLNDGGENRSGNADLQR